MSCFSFFVFCIQACLVFNVFSACLGAIIGPMPLEGADCVSPVGPYAYENTAPCKCDPKIAAPYACATEYIAPCRGKSFAAPYDCATKYIAPCRGKSSAAPYACGTEYIAPCSRGKSFAAPYANAYPYVF